MLRPPTALLRTVTSLVKYWANWLPQPAGHTVPPEGSATVESPANQTVTCPCGGGELDDGGAHGDGLGDGPLPVRSK